ncbi:class F sortase [Asanoa sp. NPDC050611]|uniref:class F sortase n=1 Tax=Asanoa sp. NPDC050611 TaxID=3157098 RepID=UPI0033CAA5F0
MAKGRLSGPLAVMLIAVGGIATFAGVVQKGAFGPDDKPPPGRFPVMEPSEPVEVRIPSLKVDAPVHDVGLADDGSIEVPALERHNQAGWFEKSPTPGQYGPAVLVGHADTRDGPSIFHDLRKVRPGARIEVERRDDSVAIFEVNSVEKFAKNNQPIERIYADFSRPALRLITCGGEFKGGSIGYVDNIVVFASLVEAKDD